MAENNGKIAIIGAGRIGSLCAWSLASSGISNEIVLVDTDQPKVHAQAMDLSDASVQLSHAVKISSGSYESCADAAVALICVGVKGTETRSAYLSKIATLLCDIAEHLNACGFSGVCVLVCSPNDILSRFFQQVSGFPARKVIGAGALLYSLRLRRLVGESFGISQDRVEVFAIGECGESQTVAWNAAKIDGTPLLKLMEESPETYGRIDLTKVAEKSRRLGWVIQDGKGQEEYGIASAACIITKAILSDSHTQLPVSAALEGAYGQQDLYAATPAIIGSQGVEQILEVPLKEGEHSELTASFHALQNMYEDLTVHTREY